MLGLFSCALFRARVTWATELSKGFPFVFSPHVAEDYGRSLITALRGIAVGMDLSLETRPEVQVKQGWTSTDGKDFIDVLFQSVDLLEKQLQLDLTPLRKLAGDEPQKEDLAEIAEMTGKSVEELLKDTQDKNSAAWQTPDELAGSLRSLIQVLSNSGQNLPLTELKSNHASDSYFEDGSFLSDLRDLLRWTEKAKNSGATQVRLFIV